MCDVPERAPRSNGKVPTVFRSQAALETEQFHRYQVRPRLGVVFSIAGTTCEHRKVSQFRDLARRQILEKNFTCRNFTLLLWLAFARGSCVLRLSTLTFGVRGVIGLWVKNENLWSKLLLLSLIFSKGPI